MTEIKMDQPAAEAAPQKKESRVVRPLLSVFSGSFLAKESTFRFFPFLIFLSAMALVYIANGYYAESNVRKVNILTNEIKEKKSEYIIAKSELMFMSKQSEVAKSAEKQGLFETVEPPLKIVAKAESPTNKTNNE